MTNLTIEKRLARSRRHARTGALAALLVLVGTAAYAAALTWAITQDTINPTCAAQCTTDSSCAVCGGDGSSEPAK